MKLKDIIKKQSLLIILTVAVVAITTIGVSYAVFFDVKKNSKDQVVTAGVLKVTLSDFTALELTEPMSIGDGLASTPVTYKVQNTGSNLDASYTLYVFEYPENTVNLSNIIVSTDGATYFILGDAEVLTEGDMTYFKIDSGSVAAGSSSADKTIRLWVDSSIGEVDGATVSLGLYIVSEVDETTSTATIQ